MRKGHSAQVRSRPLSPSGRIRRLKRNENSGLLRRLQGTYARRTTKSANIGSRSDEITRYANREPQTLNLQSKLGLERPPF